MELMMDARPFSFLTIPVTSFPHLKPCLRCRRFHIALIPTAYFTFKLAPASIPRRRADKCVKASEPLTGRDVRRAVLPVRTAARPPHRCPTLRCVLLHLILILLSCPSPHLTC